MPDHVFDNSRSDRFLNLMVKSEPGSTGFLQACLDHHAELALWAIRRALNTDLRSAHDSADFMQRIRVKLLALKPEGKHFETVPALMAYIIKMAEREVQAEKRKRKNDKKASLDALSQAEEQQMVERAPAVHDEVALEETWQIALASLSLPHQAIAIKLREEKPHQEIAAELKISERTVGRVVELLRKLLKPDEADES